MIDKNRLAEKCSTWNISLSPAQLDQLDHYAEILVSYNEKVNLTAITNPEGIEDRHFADSLLFAAQPEVQGKMVDVGTGAGFPGIVAKIYKPDLELTLMEPTGKRVEFLKYACAELGLRPWQDPHNSDHRFTRVRLRHEVLPLLEEVLGCPVTFGPAT